MALVGATALALTTGRSGEAGPDPAGVAGPTTPPPGADPDPRPATRPPGTASRTRAHFPDAGTTGVPEGVTLTRSGGVAVHEDGAVIENLFIVDGEIEVYANDVTIRNVRITNDQAFVQWGIAQRSGFSGLVVEDSEIYGNPDSPHQFASGISNHGGMITVRRVEVHTVTDGILTSHGIIEDNYLHSPRYFEDDHTDMIQSVGGSPIGLPLEIRNNTIINTESQTAAVFLSSGTGTGDIPIHNVLVEGNLLAGGGYTIYGGGSVAEGADPADIVIRDNLFSRDIFPDSGYYGPVAHFDPSAPGNVWEGNLWEDDRTPVRVS